MLQMMAPYEWLPVTAAPTSFLCFEWFCSFFASNLDRTSVPMDVQLVREFVFYSSCGLFKPTARDPLSHGSIVCTREQMLSLCYTKVLHTERPEIFCWSEVLGEEETLQTEHSVGSYEERAIS